MISVIIVICLAQSLAASSHPLRRVQNGRSARFSSPRLPDVSIPIGKPVLGAGMRAKPPGVAQSAVSVN
jgi:hypothetical protein